MKTKQVYIPYWEWEDYINGMWSKVDKSLYDSLLTKCIDFTGNHVIYGEAMHEVIQLWPKTFINSFTNPSVNHKAHLGHCAACYKIKCPEYITRAAWGFLTDKQRDLANSVAERNIKIWHYDYERKNRTVHKNMGKQMLLQWGP